MQTQPCPGCGDHMPDTLVNHLPMDGKRHAVRCPNCSLPIVRVIPLFAVAALPHGWRWVRADDKSYFKEEPAVFE